MARWTSAVRSRWAGDRAALLDAAQRVMLEQGYPRATLARIARAAGGLPRWTWWRHFRSTDQILIALLQRSEHHARPRLTLQAESSRGASELGSPAQETLLLVQFLALANHRPAVRAALAEAADRQRARETAMLRTPWPGTSPMASPRAAALVALAVSGVSRSLVLEQALGISAGHPEAVELLRTWVSTPGDWALIEALLTGPGTATGAERAC